VPKKVLLIYLIPTVVCIRVMIPDATNNVPVISLLPTLSWSIQMAGANRIGIVRVAMNIDI